MREYEFDVPEDSTIDNALIQILVLNRKKILILSRKIADYVRRQGIKIRLRKKVRIDDFFDQKEMEFFHIFTDEILSEFEQYMESSNYYVNDVCWYDEDSHYIYFDFFYNLPEKEKSAYKMIDNMVLIFCRLSLISIFVLNIIGAMILYIRPTIQTSKLAYYIPLGVFMLLASVMNIFEMRRKKYDKIWEPEISKHFAATGVENTEEK